MRNLADAIRAEQEQRRSDAQAVQNAIDPSAAPSSLVRQVISALHTRSNESSPSFSRLHAILSPGFSHTCLFAGIP